MTDKELKKLKDDLWHSADVLRSSAHLAANITTIIIAILYGAYERKVRQ